MVKIRYAALPAVNLSAYGVIQLAIEATSNKFDGNIKSNRFDAVGSHYEVTIKCKSSRGKGAKRGASGRHTTSCCWHAWGTFFEELLRLNPNIVIIAQGNRITSEGGNWVDREVGGFYESIMCDCEAHMDHEHADACGVYMPNEEETIPTEEEDEGEIDRMIAAQASAQPPVQRNCTTCRYSHVNTNSGDPECPPGSCLEQEGFQSWEPCGTLPPFHDEPNTSCALCQHAPSRHAGHRVCPYNEPVNYCLIEGQHRKFVRFVETRDECRRCIWNVNGHCEYDVHVSGGRPDSCPNVVGVVKTCVNCKHNYDDNGSQHRCHPIVGLCSSNNKWALYDPNPLVVNGTPETRYDIPLGVEQMEMVQLRPRQFKIEEVE